MFALAPTYAPSYASIAALRAAVADPAKAARPFVRAMRISDANRSRIRIDEYKIGTEVKYGGAFLFHACNGRTGDTRYRSIIEYLSQHTLVGDVEASVSNVMTVPVGEEYMLICPRGARVISRLDANSNITLQVMHRQ